MLSDHSPIGLFIGVVNSGPKPFRFFNHWLEESSFIQRTTEILKGRLDSAALISHQSSNNPLPTLLKDLKQNIRNWQGYLRDDIGAVLKRKEKVVEEIQHRDS